MTTENQARSIVITGGAGFIGSNFVHHWCENYPEDRVIVLDALTYAGNWNNLATLKDRKNFRFLQGDICDRALVDELFASENIDTVAHFAAESHVDRSILGPGAFVQTNVVGTFTLLESFRQHWLSNHQPDNYRFLHVSTDEVYGSLGVDDPAFTETTPYAPNSPYSASKAGSDHLARAYFHTYGMPTIITNCSNNYGSYHFPEKLIPLMCINILLGKPLPVYGDGNYTRDWLYVIDHARAIDLVFHEGVNHETYNIGGFNEWKNIDLVKLLCEKMDEKLGRTPGDSAKLITYVKDRPGHDLRYAIDSTKLKNELGWEPSLQFEEGLEKTVDWYLANEEWLNNVTSGNYKAYYETQYAQR
mgnify:CR=1 FL=1